jgi:outer membrane protein assembly factor BamB
MIHGVKISAVTLAGFLFLVTLGAAQAPQIQWWYDLDAPSFGSSAVGDIDGDGKPEIVFGTYFNDEKVHALNAEDGSLLWDYDTGGCNDASPVIADVDLDGELEVVVPASSPCKVFCFNGATGAVEWSASTGYNCIDSPPSVADVDQDLKPEVVFGAFNGYVYCLNGEDGSQRWKINLGSGSFIQSCPNILDVDGDEDLDVVVAQWAGDERIYALEGLDGSVLWYSDQPTDYMYHGGSCGDIDEDGKPEIAIGCYDNHVYVVNGEDGSPVWNYGATFYIGAPTSMADLNNDDHLEVVFVSYNRVGALSHTGGLLWSYSTGGNVFRGAAIADVDGDDILDVVFGSDDGNLRAVRGTDGHLVWSLNLKAHYGNTFEIDHAPVVADFDDDGKLDVFVIGGYGTSSQPTDNHGRAYMVSGGDGQGPGWLMFRHDPIRSANFHTVIGKVIHVPEDYATIQEAIGAAEDFDTVSVGPGTYTENIDFLGKAITVESSGGASATVIDGNHTGSDPVVSFQNGEGLNAVLKGFTLTNGYASAGGGIYCNGASPTIKNNLILFNEASNDGGGIYVIHAVPLISNNRMEGCEATEGAGIHLQESDATIINNVLIDNLAHVNGGGICCIDCSPTLTNNTLYGNDAMVLGGGILCDSTSHPNLTNTILWHNSAPTDPQISGDPTVVSCNVEGGWTGTGNIDEDPLFVNAGGGDLLITWLSPCVNRGANQEAPPQDMDGDSRPCMGTVDMGMDEFIDTHSLSANTFSISEATGGMVRFFLEAGTGNGSRNYMIFGSASGTTPGTPFPGGLATLPLNLDVFSNLVMSLAGTALFSGFIGTLDSDGKAAAVLNTFGPIPPGAVGLTLSFAYGLAPPWDFASNAINVEIVP